VNMSHEDFDVYLAHRPRDYDKPYKDPWEDYREWNDVPDYEMHELPDPSNVLSRSKMKTFCAMCGSKENLEPFHEWNGREHVCKDGDCRFKYKRIWDDDYDLSGGIPYIWKTGSYRDTHFREKFCVPMPKRRKKKSNGDIVHLICTHCKVQDAQVIAHPRIPNHLERNTFCSNSTCFRGYVKGVFRARNEAIAEQKRIRAEKEAARKAVEDAERARIEAIEARHKKWEEERPQREADEKAAREAKEAEEKKAAEEKAKAELEERRRKYRAEFEEKRRKGREEMAKKLNTEAERTYRQKYEAWEQQWKVNPYKTPPAPHRPREIKPDDPECDGWAWL